MNRRRRRLKLRQTEIRLKDGNGREVLRVVGPAISMETLIEAMQKPSVVEERIAKVQQASEGDSKAA